MCRSWLFRAFLTFLIKNHKLKRTTNPWWSIIDFLTSTTIFRKSGVKSQKCKMVSPQYLLNLPNSTTLFSTSRKKIRKCKKVPSQNLLDLPTPNTIFRSLESKFDTAEWILNKTTPTSRLQLLPFVHLEMLEVRTEEIQPLMTMPMPILELGLRWSTRTLGYHPQLRNEKSKLHYCFTKQSQSLTFAIRTTWWFLTRVTNNNNQWIFRPFKPNIESRQDSHVCAKLFCRYLSRI